MVEFLHDRRWKKKEIEPIFTEQCFQNVSVVYNMEVLKHFATQRLSIVQTSLRISSDFDIENYTWWLFVVQNFSCLIFLGNFVQNRILKNIQNYLSHTDW